MRLLIFFLVFSHTVSSKDWMLAFNESLSRNYWIQTQRKYEGKHKHFYLAHPSLAKRWGLINSSAEATYNGYLNTIEIKPESTIKKPGEKTRLKTIEELKATDQYAYSVKVATIFHEIGHAEFDIFVENEITEQDKKLWALVKKEIRPWFKKNHPKAKASIAVSELFSYFRTDIIETFHQDIDSILLQNGLNHYKKRCFQPRRLKAMAPQMSLEEFSHFLVMPEDQQAMVPYRDRIDPRVVYVAGKDLALHKASEPFRKEWLQALWDHFSTFHNPPSTKAELVEKIDQSHPLKELLVECRREMWNEFGAGQGSQRKSTDQSPGFDTLTH